MKKRNLYFLIAVVSAGALTAIYLPPLSRYRELKMEEELLARNLKELAAKITKLEEERDLLKNDVRYLERVIREEMGLVRPGESVYKIVEKGASKNSAKDTTVEEKSIPVR